MNNRKISIAVIVFVLIVVSMFAFAYFKKTELASVDSGTPDQEEVTNDRYSNITRIDAKHFFIDGEHTLVGEVALPTPCDLLNWDTRVAESFPEQVTVDFSVINNAEVCAEVITNQRFKVSFSASEEATISARLEGRDIELNLIPAAEGETPDDFELFIKG